MIRVFLGSILLASFFLLSAPAMSHTGKRCARWVQKKEVHCTQWKHERSWVTGRVNKRCMNHRITLKPHCVAWERGKKVCSKQCVRSEQRKKVVCTQWKQERSWVTGRINKRCMNHRVTYYQECVQHKQICR